MAERRESTPPQETSREKYFDKRMEFITMFGHLNGAIEKARKNEEREPFLRFTLTKVRTVNDFAWMEVSEQAGMSFNQFTPLLEKKQEQQKLHRERAAFNNITDIKAEKTIHTTEPLEEKYIEISQNLRGINSDIDRAKQNGAGKKYLELLIGREEVFSDFEWMETFREAGMSHDEIVDLYRKKEDRQKQAERAAFDEIVKNLNDQQR